MVDLDDIDALAETVTMEDVARAEAETKARQAEVKTRLANQARTPSNPVDFTRYNTATPRMVGYVMVLLRKLDTHNPPVAATAREWWMRHAILDTDDATRVVGSDLSFDKVSETITKLKGHLAAQPVVVATEPPTPSTPAVDGRSAFHVALEALPEGRYALPVLNDDGTPNGDKHRYFKIKISKRGHKYMVEGHGGGTADLSWGGLVPFEHGALSIAKRLAADPATFIALFGQKVGRCGDCGRLLTNDESRAVGVGPYCRGKAVWAGMPWYDGDAPTRDARAKGEDRYIDGEVTEVKTVVTEPGRAVVTRIDHSACTHPRTPAGRAACRASRG